MIDDNLALEILKEVARISNSILNLDDTLGEIIAVIRKKMMVDALVIFLMEDERLRLKAFSGLNVERRDSITLKTGEGVTGWVAQNKAPLAINNAFDDPRSIHFPTLDEGNFRSILSVPMVFNNQCVGVINVGSRMGKEFSSGEVEMLETIASQVSGCIRNALLYDKSQTLLKELALLYDVSLAVHTTINTEQRLWIILSAVTRGEAGGFNRAILFTVNTKTNMLEGTMGLGPDSPESAQRIWTELGNMGHELKGWIISEIDKDEYNRSAFNAFARSLKFPIADGDNILAEVALRQTKLSITDAWNDPRVKHEFVQIMSVNEFAIVPVLAHEKTLGVIYADNRYNAKPIQESSLNLLTQLAAHAGWIMENSRLFLELIESNRELLSTKELLSQAEKLAALGELSAEVAHEIKNPLVSIGGFARRLHDKLSLFAASHKEDENVRNTLKYAHIIQSETARLENMLKDILFYARPGELAVTDTPLRGLLVEIIQMLQGTLREKQINLQTQFDESIGPVPLDGEKIKQVLINILYNSIESMPHGGQLIVRSYREKAIKEQEFAVIYIEDTGGGIPQEIFFNIFHPFFTTKGTGTGLGLPICKKIVERHGGAIRIENHWGKGVIVYIQLPLQSVIPL